MSESKLKNDYLETKINIKKETLALMKSFIRNCKIDAVVNEPFKPYLAC